MAIETATLGGGCFWCLEAVFDDLKGVVDVVSGYAGGRRPNPTYEQVCAGVTGHAEVVQVTFDPKQIGYEDILGVFFSIHDPTTLNRQGADVGRQYRSAIFTTDAEQQRVASAYIDQIDRAGIFTGPIVTEVQPLDEFFVGEEYHQGYAASHPNQPYIAAVAMPKVMKLRKYFGGRLKTAK
jgi:peptide-methionine (S)-S-oxide reductase